MSNFSAISFLFHLVFALVSYITIGPLILLLCLVNEVIRLIISVYLKRKYNGNISLVSDGADAVWTLKRKNRTRMVVVGLKLSKPVSLEQISKCFKEQVFTAQDGKEELIYSKLKMILVTKFGYACWKRDEKFEIKNHVRSLSSKNIYTKNQLSTQISFLCQDMNEFKPQWETIYVPRYKESEEEAENPLLLFRWHHALMDGFSLVMMFKNHMSSGFDYIVHPQKFTIPFWKKVLFYTNTLIMAPSASLMTTVYKFKSFWPTISYGKCGAPAQKNYTWTKSIDLRAVRNLRKSLNSVSIPTILENAFITAAREILPKERVPNEWRIGEVAALLPYPTTYPQNRFSIFYYGVNSLQPDYERIQSCKQESWKAITGPWIPLTFATFKFTGRFPVVASYSILKGASSSILLSNLPLSKTKFKFLDTADVLDVIGFPPLPNDVGIFLFSAAYENTLKISASSDSTWLKGEELEKILQRIPNILEDWTKKWVPDRNGNSNCNANRIQTS